MGPRIWDEAASLEMAKYFEGIRRSIEPYVKLNGIPFSQLGDAFKIAHGLPTPPCIARAGSRDEPYPRTAIANYLMLKMMYVSGETGEPSVETTSIIEDIVRQQVIEIVSIPTWRLHHSVKLTPTAASKLYRAGCASWVEVDNHQ